ncbi:unnamed protein product, partial [Coregonus sp. 'balchen']
TGDRLGGSQWGASSTESNVTEATRHCVSHSLVFHIQPLQCIEIQAAAFDTDIEMGKDPTKPRGKMSSYAYFVQTCREEHKKKHPEASTMSAKEKGKFEDLAKLDKVRYEREMRSYIPPKGEKKKRFKDPNAPKRPSSAFFIFCADFRPQVKGETPGLSIGDVAKKLGEKWNNLTAEDKVPYEKKAAKLKEKYEKIPVSC